MATLLRMSKVRSGYTAYLEPLQEGCASHTMIFAEAAKVRNRNTSLPMVYTAITTSTLSKTGRISSVRFYRAGSTSFCGLWVICHLARYTYLVDCKCDQCTLFGIFYLPVRFNSLSYYFLFLHQR